ncbi:uncharacterized protein M6B38_358915 [Iris pallida]|uniref:Uncharacterized protein n=1 Tax=Iris pallida TaxID=29817 RepID=A0AAX6GKQ9_IRIPA|nr:uncharacterized protein M6B38_358915 [Iris pallida]
MGCSGSKQLEELEAVSLCRARTNLLADAIRHRYALADAHAAYAHSLRSLSSSLRRLILQAGPSSNSSHLPLPPQRKGDPLPPSASDSHIQFHSSDSGTDDDDDDDISPLHSDNGDEHHHHHHLHRDHDVTETEPVVRLHYARSQPPPSSVAYSHRPPAEAVHFADHPYVDPYGYEYYGSGGGGGFFGSFPPNLPPHASSSSSALPKPAAGAAAAPPPPPPAPRASTWDFLNPFEANESYYPPYTPSRASNEVRDAEGIPDLEDEEHEVVKAAYGDHKSFPSTSASTSAGGSPVEHLKERVRSAAAVDEADEDVVEKNVMVADQVQQRNAAAAAVMPAAAAASPAKQPRRFLDVSEIGDEIVVQGDRAFSSVMEMSGVLEVGKHLYNHHRSAVYKVPAVMTCVMPPSDANGEDFLIFEEDMERSSKNLSSTLHKLYIWENKLHDEVRAEEKMRLLYDRNCKKLKRLDEKGAESHKLDEVQKLVRKLSTKIRIAIQVVNSISTKVNKLRDEELWPQIKELIQGLVRMWKAMLESHRIQCEAISEAKGLDSISSGGRLSETCLDAMMQLELELLRWIGNFSAWINAQKNYVKAINGWLILCLHYEPEVTADGIPPYSPGRVGAPPVFVICNYWSQALDRLPEKEVIDVMQAFATKLRRLWEQHSFGQHQQLMANREMDMWVKAREREAQIMHREVDELNKKLVLVSGQDVLPGQNAELSSLHVNLKQVFEAMENFTANSFKAYEELHMHSEEGL